MVTHQVPPFPFEDTVTGQPATWPHPIPSLSRGRRAATATIQVCAREAGTRGAFRFWIYYEERLRDLRKREAEGGCQLRGRAPEGTNPPLQLTEMRLRDGEGWRRDTRAGCENQRHPRLAVHLQNVPEPCGLSLKKSGR